MNIVYVHRTQDGGVESVHIWETARSLKALGHQVRVHSPSGETFDPRSDHDGRRSNSSVIRARILKWSSLYLPELLFELAELIYNVFALRALLRDFSDLEQPLVYERYAFFGVAGFLFSRIRRCPWFLELNYTSQCEMVRKRSAILRPVSKAIERKLVRSANGIVVVSGRLKEQLINDYGTEPEKILVLANAADPATFRPDISPIARIDSLKPADYKIIGYVGAFNPWHGLDVLIRAFGTLVSGFPDARLLMIGDGPTRKKIERLAADLGLSDKVVFAGEVAHDRLPRYVSTFRFGALPNSNDYGSPMKVFEYMAMGKPVVVPDYPPLTEVIEDGRQGFIFQRNNMTSLANGLCQALADDAAHERMSREARQCITETHNWHSNAKRFLQFAETRL